MQQTNDIKTQLLKIIVVDESSHRPTQDVILLPLCEKQSLILKPGTILVLKDIYHGKDKKYYMDCYSRIYNLNDKNVNEISKSVKLTKELVSDIILSTSNIIGRLENISQDSIPTSLTSLTGDIIKVAYTTNEIMHCFHCGNEDVLNESESCIRCSKEMLFIGSKIPCLLIDVKNFHVVLKVLKSTWSNLTKSMTTTSNLKSLCGMSIGPLDCAFIRVQNPTTLHLNEVQL